MGESMNAVPDPRQRPNSSQLNSLSWLSSLRAHSARAGSQVWDFVSSRDVKWCCMVCWDGNAVRSETARLDSVIDVRLKAKKQSTRVFEIPASPEKMNKESEQIACASYLHT